MRTFLVVLVPLGLALVALAGCSGRSADGDLMGNSTGTGTSGGSSGTSGTSGGVTPTPREVPQATFTGETGGCSNVLAYRATTDKRQLIVVSIDRDKLGLAVGDRKTIELGEGIPGVDVGVDVYANVPPSETYCNDYQKGDEPPKARWTAQAGKLTIELTREPDTNGVPSPTYRATIRLERVHLTGPEGGAAVVVPSAAIESVRVGWLPG